ncbi:MAG: hypothetical protein ABI905_18410, partial [Betaproteobacteria bacterium]
LPAWKREGTDLIYRVILHVPSRPDVELRMVRTIAERRLTLLPAQAATIDKVNRIGFTTANAWSLTMYEKVAAAYSQVLGRTVSPAQLLTETDLQVQLQIEAQRKAALQVDAQK